MGNKDTRLNIAIQNTKRQYYRHNNNEAALAIFLTSSRALRKGEKWYMAELVYVGLGLQNSFLCISIDNFQLHVFIWYSLKYYCNRIFHSQEISDKKLIPVSVTGWSYLDLINIYSRLDFNLFMTREVMTSRIVYLSLIMHWPWPRLDSRNFERVNSDRNWCQNKQDCSLKCQ
jgi:hypothetical protein